MVRILTDDEDQRIAKHMDSGDQNGDTVVIRTGKVPRYLRSILTFALGIAIVLVIWHTFAWYENTYSGVALKFPTPMKTFERMYDMFFEETLLLNHTIYEHIIGSLERWLIGFTLAAVVGLAIGFILGYFTSLYPIGIVPVSVFQMIPGLAWLPIAILLLGFGNEAAVFIIFAVSSVTIAVNVTAGIRRIPPVVTRASKMMGAGGAVMFLKITIPYATVDIVNGLRLGMASAWRVLIAAEMLVPVGIGLGYAITMSRTILDYVGAFACVAIICIIGLLLDKVVFARIEKYARSRLGLEEGA